MKAQRVFRRCGRGYISTMMDFMTGGGLSSVLAPKLEVGREALCDAIKARDTKRATRIVKRVQSGRAGAGAGTTRRAGNSGSGSQTMQEVDLNAPDARGLRPIHLAAMMGMSETVAALLDAGVPPDAMGAEGNTALHLASHNKEEGAVAVLMRAGASPTQENVKGSTAIDLAKTEMTLTLLCPLHYCAARGMLDNLVAEVAKGRSVNSLGKGGDTPLHAAAAAWNADTTRLLLARAADPLRKNAAGETPLDVARRAGQGRGADGGRSGGDLVRILEGAVEEAQAAKAAAEAKKIAKLGAYQEGEAVVYVRGEESHPAVVMKVHRDDEEPYYTVRVDATGRERQTDANHLVRSLPREPPRSGASDGDEGGRREKATAEPVEPVDAAGSGSHSSGSSSAANGTHTPTRGWEEKEEAVQGPGKGGARESSSGAAGAGADAWAASSAKLLDLAADLSGATVAAGTEDIAPGLAHTLAAAFSSMPGEEMRAIFLRKLREGSEEEGRRQRECGQGEGGGGSIPDRSVSVDCAQGEVDGGEGDQRVALAVADACRDLVLTCLLGGTGRQK